MSKKTEERLRWALRYVMCHPDLSPDVLSKEWKIPIDDAINICATNLGTVVYELGIGLGETGERSFQSLEKNIFQKLIELS